MQARPRLIFLNRYFFPDHSSSSQLLSALAFHLAQSELDVHVITSRQLYDDPQHRLPAEETIERVRVHRVSTTKFGRSGLVGRSVDYASFYLAAWRALSKLTQRGDVIVAMTDPPLLSIIAARVAKRRQARLVNWLQDLYPEVAVQLGVSMIKGPLAYVLCAARDASLNSAAMNVVVGERMRERLSARGIAGDRIEVIHNWCDDETIRPVPAADNPLRREWGLEGKFVIGYSGNLGRAHEFMTVLAASERLKDNEAIRFVLIGGGHHFEAFARCVKERGLEQSYRFIPYQDQSLLKCSLCVPDVHWISLSPQLEGLIVPSKFYGIAAAGRPIVAITAGDGELARLIRTHACGVVVQPGDSKTLAESILQLSNDSQRRAQIGARARAMLEGEFNRKSAFERWSSVLGPLLNGEPRERAQQGLYSAP